MNFLQLQNADFDPSESMNCERVIETSLSSSSFNILDQIKRSAGNTPAKKRLVQKDFVDTVQSSNMDTGFAGFINNMTASTLLSSSSEDLQTKFSLFQTSSSRTTKDDSRQEDVIKSNFDHDGHRDDSDDEWTSRRLDQANGNNGMLDPSTIRQHHRHQQPQQQQHKMAPVERTFRVMDTQCTESTSAEETNKSSSSPLHSVTSQSSSTDTSWDEDGDVLSASLLDNTDGEDDDQAMMMGEGDDEDLYDDDDDEDGSSDDGSYSDGMGEAVTAVESFLDDLSVVGENVQQFGTLLYQVGSCTFTGGNMMNAAEDDDFTVGSDTFPETMGGEAYVVRQRGRSTAPRPILLPTLSDSHDLLNDAADSFSQIFQNLSMQADSILEIVSSHSSTNNSNDDEGAAGTPNYFKRSFFQSMFNCNR